MDTATTADGFARAVAEALPALRAGADALQQLRLRVDGGHCEFNLMQLQSLVLLADHRGRHLVSDEPSSPGPEVGHDWHGRLVAVRDQLISQTTARTPFDGLQFVDEVAELCREMGQYVDGA